MKVIQAFFHSKHLLKALNRTYMVLIPKIDNPTKVEHFCPICLCNTIYKTISSLIAFRIKPLLVKLISPYQNAFTPDQNITDNILIAQEVLHSIKYSKSKIGKIALKLDFEKAFDKLEWPFIESTLRRHGFPNYWINIIMECVSTQTTQILFNNRKSKTIYPTWGLRQGNPLSPLLFIICMDVLVRSLLHAYDSNHISALSAARGGPPIPILSFADDCLLFLKANRKSNEHASMILETFCQASGQTINRSKSSIIFSPYSSQRSKNNTKEIFAISNPKPKEKYLGLPFLRSRMTKSDFAYLVEKANARLHGWYARKLSYAGRACLIDAALTPIATYSMASTQLPISTVDSLQRCSKRFYWNSS